MSTHTFIQALLAGCVASGYIVLFYLYKRWEKQYQNGTNTLATALNRDPSEQYDKIRGMVVDQHRDHETLKATVEQLELKHTDIADMMQRRYARLSTRITREAQEGEESDASTTGDQAELLLRDVGLEDDNGVAQQSGPQGRSRLRRRSTPRYRR